MAIRQAALDRSHNIAELVADIYGFGAAGGQKRLANPVPITPEQLEVRAACGYPEGDSEPVAYRRKHLLRIGGDLRSHPG